jgi:septum formation protein
MTDSFPVKPTVEPLGLVLASQSPRRRRLLEWLGVPFTCASVETPESLVSPLAAYPSELAKSLAAEKAVAAREAGLGADSLVLCFDTIVVLDGQALGKPCDVPDAWRMLRALSGRTHDVVTGVAMLAPEDAEPRTFAVSTPVRMRTLSDADVELWMAHGTFMGCAGAYNIEAQVAEVGTCDCYQNVAGLPLCHLYAALARTDADSVVQRLTAPLAVPVTSCDEALGRTCVLGPDVCAR